MWLSIIIPVLNEADTIGKTIDHILQSVSNLSQIEILVVDGGSTDTTMDVLKNLPVKTFYKPLFSLKKHESLNYGIEVASGEIVMFLDADTLLPKDFDILIKTKIDASYIGGAFEMRFIHADLKLYLLSRFNQLRYRLWKHFFGDQAIFCRRDVAIDIGGFQDSLMEAALFCKSLKKKGKIGIINAHVMTSARRFRNHGFWKVFWFDFRMWIRFIFNLRMKTYREIYWRANLKNG